VAVLTEQNTIAANQTVSVFYHGIAGLLTGSQQITQGIMDAFAGTAFVVEAVNIPTLSEIEPPNVVGHLQDRDGAGHSTIAGRDITVAEFTNFFLSRMEQVSGLYEVGINKIETGAITPTLFSDATTTSIWLVVGVVALLALAVIVWKVWP
jgi:hypothetical protein